MIDEHLSSANRRRDHGDFGEGLKFPFHSHVHDSPFVMITSENDPLKITRSRPQIGVERAEKGTLEALA